jgi:magnesium transporter
MFDAFIRFGDGRTRHCADPEQLSAAFLDAATGLWVDICAPAEADYALLKDLFGFHPLAVEDVVHEVQRPKLESYAMVGDKLKQDYFFMVIHGPALDPDPTPISFVPGTPFSFRN